MYTRVLTFSGVEDIDAGVKFAQETVLPILQAQNGYRGMTASADRAGRILGFLSLWETAADREASDSALAKTREEARQIVGGELSIENFEEQVVEISEPPGIGSRLLLTRLSMDPTKVKENVEFFKAQVAPQIKAGGGFRALRNMIDPKTGNGVVGTVWADEAAATAAANDALARREQGQTRGVTFGDMSQREILLVDLK